MNHLEKLFRALFLRSRAEHEIEQELRFHIESYTDDLIASGLSRDEAERRACIEFGGTAQIKEDCRRSLWLHLPVRIGQDTRYALRGLKNRPGFTVFAMSILAIGIALNTLIYTVTDSVLLRRLPFPQPERLVAAWELHPIIGRQEVAVPDFRDWQARNRTFSELAAYTMQGDFVPLWTGMGEPEPLQATLASWNLFSLVGITPGLGRVYGANDDRPGRDHVVVLSHSLWVSRFGADPNAIGKSMALDGELFRIIGVLPETAVPRWADIWLPLARSGPDTPPRRASHNLEVLGRLKPGTSVAQADSDLRRIAIQLAAEYPVTNGPTRAAVIPIRRSAVEQLKRPILLLQAGAALVLLICCANVAIFCLVRAAERQSEFEIRAALGATPQQLLAASLTEAFVLSLGAGGLGFALARAALSGLDSHIRTFLPPACTLHFDWRTLAFSIGTCVVTALLFGLYPSLQAVRHIAMRGPSRTVTRRNAPARVMIAVQTALAVVVLVCAGLLVRSFRQILSVEPGIETRRLITLRVSLPLNKYKSESTAGAFYNRLFPRILAVPGVTGVAASAQEPLRRLPGRFWIDGRPDPPPNQFPVAQVRAVSPEYFHVLGIGLQAGRLPCSTGEPHRVAWVNLAFQRRYFEGSSAIGHSILQGLFGPQRRRVPIVGVVADTRDLGLEIDPEPAIYWVESSARSTLAIRVGDDDISGIERGVRAALSELEPEAWAAPMASMQEVYERALNGRHIALELMAIFAAIAYLLAGLGIYAVVAQAVAERVRETAIRLAMGAGHRDVIRMFMLANLRAVAAGLAIGAALAVISASSLEKMLFGVGTADPATYWITGLVILAIAAAAAYVPARRSVRVSIVAALRAE